MYVVTLAVSFGEQASKRVLLLLMMLLKRAACSLVGIYARPSADFVFALGRACCC